MLDNDCLIQLANYSTPHIIKVIGVGGGGGNAVAQMYRDNIAEVRYVVANTDRKALDDNPVPYHVQLGPGLGAGGNPTTGRELAQQSIEQIDAILDDDTKMVFITAGMGGGTGTGASPVIARESKRKGILTIGIVTIPFLFERERQIDKALDGLEVLAREVDAVLVINNQRLCDIYPDLSIINAFKRADETLSNAVASITEIISMHGRVNLDFQDVSNALTNGGVAVMSSGYGEGAHRVTQAINCALTSPLLNNNDVYAASHILLAITTSRNNGTLLMSEIDEVTTFMNKFRSDIDTKWGMALDDSLGNKVKITIIASGFGLYNNKRPVVKPYETVGDDSMQEQMSAERIGNFYGKKPKVKRRVNAFKFSMADLDNEELLAQVEAVPTYRRSLIQLEEMTQQSR